jgi:ABC-2 type transport system permease protein
MSDERAGLGRVLAAEWIKLRSVRSTAWTAAATLGLTVLLGVLICAAVDTSGGGADCPPGAPGCGDEDVVLNSLSGVYIGQIAVVALAVLTATSEYDRGTIRTTYAAVPRRLRVVAAKIGAVATIAFVVGLAASVTSFLAGQPILHGNGFTATNGYPAASLADEPTARAVGGTALYLVTVALLALGAGFILRRAGSAIAAVLALLYVPTMVALTLPADVRDVAQSVAPMSAGLAVQRTVERVDSVPVGPWAGLGVASAWAAAMLLAAAWLVRKRDA